jgi:hypothetical protein
MDCGRRQRSRTANVAKAAARHEVRVPGGGRSGPARGLLKRAGVYTSPR